MSEVKLYVLSQHGVFVDYRPATADEIKAAHPKCATCVHKGSKDWHGFVHFTCRCAESTMLYSAIEPSTDYCRHHEPREERNAD